MKNTLVGLKWWYLQRSFTTRFLITPQKLYFCELWQLAVQNNLIIFWAIEQPYMHKKKDYYVTFPACL